VRVNWCSVFLRLKVRSGWKKLQGEIEEHEMKQLYARGIQRLAQAPLFIDDTPALNIFELRAKCRRLKNKHNIGMVIIDYCSDERNGREQEQQSRTGDQQYFKKPESLAKELSIPIIALSQLSREVEKRGAKDGTKCRSSVTFVSQVLLNRMLTWSCSYIARNIMTSPPTKWVRITVVKHM
jgi:replicative DNA helicase